MVNIELTMAAGVDSIVGAIQKRRREIEAGGAHNFTKRMIQ
jgi:hypothetical protein